MVPTLCRCRQAARCRAVLWVAFFAAWHVAVVQSCSDVTMFNTTMYDALISARNYDFFAQKVLTLQFSVIPEGTDIQYTPLTGCTSPQGLSESQRRSKYSWICVSVGRPELLAGFGIGCEGRFDGRSFAGQCIQGINTAGLSAGALTQQSMPFPPDAQDKPGQQPGVYFNDIPGFLLANFKTVAEIKEQFTPANYRVVNNPQVYEILFKLSKIAATRINHYAIHDATGASAVIEFINEAAADGSTQFSWRVYDNPQGVLTNSPGFPEQLSASEQFQAQQAATYGINGLLMTPGFGGVGWDVTTPENNNANSMSRFTIVSQLKKNVANSPFPDPSYLESPASNPDPAHKATIMALRLLDWVKVPGHWPSGPEWTPGPAPNNQLIGEQEMTIMQFITNHRRLTWFARTAANEQWVKFDLKKIFGVPSLEKPELRMYEASEGLASTMYGGRRDHHHGPRDKDYERRDRDYDSSHSDYERRDRDYDNRHNDYGYGRDDSHPSPVRRPLFKNVGLVAPPTRIWATDLSDDLMTR